MEKKYLRMTGSSGADPKTNSLHYSSPKAAFTLLKTSFFASLNCMLVSRP